MAIVHLNDKLIEIDGRVRLEHGPVLKTAIASVELLTSGELADHYKLSATAEMILEAYGVETLKEAAPLIAANVKPKKQPPHGYAIVARDKLGNPIVDGQEFPYLDWNGQRAWHLYELCGEDWTDPPGEIAWRRRGHYFDKAEGMVAAEELAASLGGV